MKIKALVIAPYRGLAELTTSLTDQLEDFDVTIIQGDLSESLHLIRKYEGAGYDVIISRGGTAKLIRGNSSLPVVEIKVSGFDILRLITLLKEYKTRIEMIGFPNIIEAVVSVSRLLDVNIPHTIIYEEDEVNQALEEAKKKGALVIVGGSNTVRLAKEQGLQGILITSGKESVLEAFENARIMYQSISRYKTKNVLLEGLTDGIETGMAVIQPDGELRYCNQSFMSMLNISSGKEAGLIFTHKFPKLTEMLQKAVKKRDLQASFGMFDPTHKHKLSIVSQPGNQEDWLFNVYVRPLTDNEQDIQVQNLGKSIGTFPQIIRARADFQESFAIALDCMRKREPLTVHGEIGTGKRILVGTIQTQLGIEDDHLLDVTVIRGSDEAFEHLKQLVENAQANSICYVRGLERFPAKLQRKLLESLRHCRALLIASFEKAPMQLKEEGLLEADFFDFLCKTVIRMKTLRENLQELEELVTIFISENNEKYGKQVVGIRPKVLEALYENSWKGNLIELRDTVKELVKSSRGEYIDEDSLAALEKNRAEQSSGSGTRTINLDQPFQSIQKEIIQIVLQEENMNQSRAAKRLGLNRSTLWRILKDNS